MKIISVTNQKGGCGKTITAVNLASALEGTGNKVLLVDLDPQSHASCSLGVKEPQAEKTSYFLFDEFIKGSVANIAAVMKQRSENMWVIPSHISLSTMEQKLSDKNNSILALLQIFKENDNHKFDYVILDTPPSLGFLTLNAMHAAKQVIIPIDVSLFSLNGVNQIFEILEISSTMGFKLPQINFLITIYDSRSNFSKNFIMKARNRFNDHLLKTIIRSNIKLREATLEAKTIFEYAPESNGAKDYLSLVQELVPALKGKRILIRPREKNIYKKDTIFKIYAPDAKSVHLVGSFNNWFTNTGASMKRLSSGAWTKTIPLPRGTYLYKFVVDNKWIEDPLNTITENDRFGGKNSIMRVQQLER